MCQLRAGKPHRDQRQLNPSGRSDSLHSLATQIPLQCVLKPLVVSCFPYSLPQCFDMQNVYHNLFIITRYRWKWKGGLKWLPTSARPLLSALCRALTVRGRKGACSLYPSNTPSSVSMTQGFRGFKGEKGEPGQPGLDGLDAPCQLVQYPLFLSSPVHATILCVHTMA